MDAISMIEITLIKSWGSLLNDAFRNTRNPIKKKIPYCQIIKLNKLCGGWKNLTIS
jgi:hypothetical protein